ncbi:MAG: DUF5615 family PIN-like protein [Niabella sp.]
MKFVADESVDAAIVHGLRDSGYEVFAIAEHSPGIEDEEVLKISNSAGCLLITQDKDFGELVYRLGKAHEGVILLRLAGLNTNKKAEITVTVIDQHKSELPFAFTVVYKDFIKIRHSW